MAAIENERDLILQATVPRVLPVLIPIDKVDGLPGRLDGIDDDIEALGIEVNSVLSNTQDISIRVTNLTVTNSTSTVLTVVRKNGITGTVTWSLFAGNGTLQGSDDSRSIAGNTITSASVTVRAAIGSKEVFATINKLGAISAQDTVNLTTQVTGQLANSKVSGLGALALLNTVNLNTQTTGALNGQTQVTNLGNLAYANSIAANQIGAGQLAAGVIYAGTIAADQVTSGEFIGRSIRTASTGRRAELMAVGAQSHQLRFYDALNTSKVIVSLESGVYVDVASQQSALNVTNANGIGGAVQGTNNVGLVLTSNSASALVLQPIGSIPAKRIGGMAYHSTHGFIFCNGTSWFKHAASAWELVA